MNDEVAHLGVVDRHLRLGFPDRIGSGVVGIHADAIYLVESLEGDVFEIGELAADHEVKQLRLDTVRHVETFLIETPGKADVRGARRSGQGDRRFLKCPTMRACRSRPAATSTPCTTSRRL